MEVTFLKGTGRKDVQTKACLMDPDMSQQLVLESRGAALWNVETFLGSLHLIPSSSRRWALSMMRHAVGVVWINEKPLDRWIHEKPLHCWRLEEIAHKCILELSIGDKSRAVHAIWGEWALLWNRRSRGAWEVWDSPSAYR